MSEGQVLHQEDQATEQISELEAPSGRSANSIKASGSTKSPMKVMLKQMLSQALQQANSAVALDTNGSTQNAVNEYSAACSILRRALQKFLKPDDQEPLQGIITVYENRIEELRSEQVSDNLNADDEKQQSTPELPAEPFYDESVSVAPVVPAKKDESLPRWHNNGYEPEPDRVDWFRIRTMLILILLALALSLQLVKSWTPRDLKPLSAKGPDVPFEPCQPLKDIPKHLKKFQDCSINNFLSHTQFDFLRTAKPLQVSEYELRRNRLAQALVSDGLDAFMVEPGYTLEYYAAVSQPRWEVWEPEERPFVMVVRPYETSEGEIVANTSFLVPSFEAERARLLNMPFEEEPSWVTYEEHWNPYATLVNSEVFASFRERRPRIMVDEEMRDFISRGLSSNGFDVVGLGGEIERVRQIKSYAEVGILRAVNTGTVEAVRAVRKCMKLGQTEDDVMQALDNTMRCAGLDPFFDIVLFDEDASNPHGGTNGSKVLEKETMVLIDVGAHLYGYSSDICRSFFGPWLSKPKDDQEYDALSASMKEKLKVWDIVFEAQTVSLSALYENSTAAAVDVAARDVISEAGYGKEFTHRVGHGIGIKAHESPYLNKGNINTTLKAGMAFTSEPGIYLVNKFGVRHEDVLLVRESGLPWLLTGQRARSPWEP
jgi:Xaa-Pro aminopeptidase